DRPPHRRLLAGRHAVRAADVASGVRGEGPAGVTEAGRLRGAAATAAAGPGHPGGAGNHRAQSDGEEPCRALRHGPGAGRRPAPLAVRPADPGAAAVADAAGAEMGTATQ